MTLKVWNNEKVADYELNSNFSSTLKVQGRNLIRQLQDRAVAFSSDGGEWAEAYIDTTGRLNSVSVGDTTAKYDWITGGKYTSELNINVTSLTTINSGYTNPDNAFDNNGATDATRSAIASPQTTYIGKTFTSTYVKRAYVQAEGYSQGNTAIIKLQSYKSSTWGDIITLDSGETASYLGYVDVDDTIEGLRLYITLPGSSSNDASVTTLDFVGATSEVIITHDIPSGTFSSTISGCFGTFLAEDWETGADVQYKLTGTAGAEDTGWLNTNEFSSFTAFTTEPDTCIVKLIPKTSSPTTGYPSINGFFVSE